MWQDYAVVAATLHLYLKHVSHLDLGALHLNLAITLHNVGAYDVALMHFQRALVLNRAQHSWIQLFQLLALPVVWDSTSAMDDRLATMQRHVREALEDGMTVSRPHDMKELYSSTYLLPFMGASVCLCVCVCVRVCLCASPYLCRYWRCLYMCFPRSAC